MLPCQNRNNPALAVDMIEGALLKKFVNTDGFCCPIEEK